MESERSLRSENNEQDLITEERKNGERDEDLKKRISTHPLYGLLVEAHLECLKVGDISDLDREHKIEKERAINKHNLGMSSQSELDLFMEAYCLTLDKFKEAMEEPQQTSMAFINNMHTQLRELTRKPMPAPAEHDTTTSSGDCKFERNSTI